MKLTLFGNIFKYYYWEICRFKIHKRRICRISLWDAYVSHLCVSVNRPAALKNFLKHINTVHGETNEEEEIMCRSSTLCLLNAENLASLGMEEKMNNTLANALNIVMGNSLILPSESQEEMSSGATLEIPTTSLEAATTSKTVAAISDIPQLIEKEAGEEIRVTEETAYVL